MNSAPETKSAELGAHAILQDRAEKNARLILAIQMEDGLSDKTDFPLEKFPTDQLRSIAYEIGESLRNGRLGWAEVFQDLGNHEIITISQELDAAREKGILPNIHSIKTELHAFHLVKSRQLLAWKLQAAMDKGEDVSQIIAELACLDAEAVDSGGLLARAYAVAFNPDEIPPTDETCMVIGDVPVAARGNLTALQGKSKVGKSAVVSAILGAAQRGQYAVKGDTLRFEWQGLAEGAIIHLDTEQSRSDWHGLVSRSVSRSGMPGVSDRLVSFPLVMFARGERMAIMEGALAQEADKHGRIDAVLIDGIADLCASPNDEAESLELISRIHALAQKYDCPIFAILHENPSTDQGKTRGHLGSELNRKAFANLRIDKDTETSISTIFGTDMRKRDLPREQGFCFAWDEAAGMHLFQGRAAGLKAAQREEKAVSDAREKWEPIYEIASQRENTPFPALSPKEAAEIEQEKGGNENLTKADTMKKRMQKAETLGVLRKSDLLRWTLNAAGTAGK